MKPFVAKVLIYLLEEGRPCAETLIDRSMRGSAVHLTDSKLMTLDEDANETKSQ